ncbi:MAG: hypothetical protein AAF750_10545 [Planctomycetota bacterium]
MPTPTVRLKPLPAVGMLALVLSLTACFTGCAPLSPEQALDVATDANRTVSERVDAVDLLGAEQIGLFRRLVWSEHEPDRVRIKAWDRWVEVDAEVWPDVERRLAVVRSMALLEAVCRSLPEAERERMTPVLLRSLARRSWGGLGVTDDERPEWIGLGWETEEQRRVGLRAWVLRKGGPRRASESAWVVLCRWDGVENQRGWLLSLDVSHHLGVWFVDPLVWCARHTSRLPQSFEELDWLTSVWPGVRQRRGSKVYPRDLAVRHLPIYNGVLESIPSASLGWRNTTATRIDGDPTAGLDQPYGSVSITHADKHLLMVVASVVSPAATRAVLFGQADRDVMDSSTEHGGLLEVAVDDGVSGAVPFAPLVVGDDHRYVPPPELFDRLLTPRGIAYYHFHAQSFDQRAFAGPGMGDLRVAARLGVTSVVFTFLDRDTLNVDVILPGVTAETMPTVVDLGSIKRP